MALQSELIVRSGRLSDLERTRIERHLASLGKRLQKFPDPRAELAVELHPRRWDVDLRVSLGPLGGHLVSHQSAETVDLAAKTAVDDVKRQLERRLAAQRGESTYGVPSRRLPEQLRPSSISTVEDEDNEDLNVEDTGDFDS